MVGQLQQITRKKEGWAVGTELVIEVDDPVTLLELKKEAAMLGKTVAKVMIISKDQMENCTSTVCIESDNNNNAAIQEIATKMKTILLGGSVKQHSLLQNTKPVSALHASKLWLR